MDPLVHNHCGSSICYARTYSSYTSKELSFTNLTKYYNLQKKTDFEWQSWEILIISKSLADLSAVVKANGSGDGGGFSIWFGGEFEQNFFETVLQYIHLKLERLLLAKIDVFFLSKEELMIWSIMLDQGQHNEIYNRLTTSELCHYQREILPRLKSIINTCLIEKFYFLMQYLKK